MNNKDMPADPSQPLTEPGGGGGHFPPTSYPGGCGGFNIPFQPGGGGGPLSAGRGGGVIKQREVDSIGLTKLETFTKAAMQGLCANPDLTHTPAIDLGYKAVDYAEAALAELERRNEA